VKIFLPKTISSLDTRLKSLYCVYRLDWDIGFGCVVVELIPTGLVCMLEREGAFGLCLCASHSECHRTIHSSQVLSDDSSQKPESCFLISRESSRGHNLSIHFYKLSFWTTI